MTRSFKINSPSSNWRYIGNTPGEAAKKAADYLFFRNGCKSPLIFFLKETTRGGKNEIHKYTAIKNKLKKPHNRTHRIVIKKGGTNNNNQRRSDYKDDEWKNSQFDDMPNLIRAILRLDYDDVKKCLDMGDDPNLEYNDLDPIGTLIEESYGKIYKKSTYISIIKLLVERGANLFVRIINMFAFAKYDMLSYVLSLDIDLYENIIPIDNRNKKNLISVCFEYGDLKCVKMLADKYNNIDYNYVDNNGNSLLHLIVGTNINTMIEEKIQFLIDNNIDIYIKNKDEMTAYDILLNSDEHRLSTKTIALIKTSKYILYNRLPVKYPKSISSDVQWFAEDLFPEEKTPTEGDWFYNTRDINDKKEIIRIYNKEVLNKLIFNPISRAVWNDKILARFTIPKNNNNTNMTGGKMNRRRKIF